LDRVTDPVVVLLGIDVDSFGFLADITDANDIELS
jgi:hypothetical protein